MLTLLLISRVHRNLPIDDQLARESIITAVVQPNGSLELLNCTRYLPSLAVVT